MSLTIPIRAQKSTLSWGPGRLGHSFAKARFVVSMMLFGIVMSALVVGTTGSLMQLTSARDYRRDGYNSRQGRSDERTQSGSTQTRQTTPTNTNTSGTSSTQRTTPRQTPVEKQPAAPVVQTPPPATPQITPSSTVIRETPMPAPVDTAPASEQMTIAQAEEVTTQPVVYTSQKISNEVRDRLIILAAVASFTGALLYTMSYFATASSAPRRSIPVRYVAPVREAVTS